jgi:hypothetical protein
VAPVPLEQRAVGVTVEGDGRVPTRAERVDRNVKHLLMGLRVVVVMRRLD